MEESAKSNAKRSVSKIQLPIKKFVSVVDMCQANDDKIKQNDQELRTSSDGGTEIRHDDEEFCVFCICKICLEYREIALQLVDDCIKTRSMWKILQGTMKKFYGPIIKKISNAAMKFYEDLLYDEKFDWITNGIFDKTKLKHIHFMSDLSLTDNMTFVLLSALLTVDDAHQLFELLSYQIECFAKAYAEGLKEKYLSKPEEEVRAEDVIVYILQGYKELNKIAEITSSFLFTFESNHLKQFSLSWPLLNKRMYQKWVYSEFISSIPEYIIKLKDEVDLERYAMLVKEYISFDEDMTAVDKEWLNVWIKLNKYYSSTKEEERRKRLKVICSVFDVIKNTTSRIPSRLQFIESGDWETHSNRDLVWQNVIGYVKQAWSSTNEMRLYASNCNHLCKNCSNSEGGQRTVCNCLTCLIAGGPDLSKIAIDVEKHGCEKCTTSDVQMMDESNEIAKATNCCVDLNETKQLNSLNEDESLRDPPASSVPIETYHLSWAVFKHLKDRKPYSYPTINEMYFCSNCNRTCCLLAKKILNNEMAFGLSQYLVNHYQPFSLTHDEMAEMLPNIMLYNRKVISMNLTYDPPSDDIVVKTFWTFIISAFASYFVDAEIDSKKPNLNNLKLINNDIELPMEYIELNNKAIKFLDFIEKIKGLLQTDSHCQVHSKIIQKDSKAIENRTDSNQVSKPKKEEKPSAICEKPSTNKTHTVEATSAAGKQWDKNLSKTKHHGIQCCSDHLEELENCKENHFSKMCFHEKECSHVRVNETRDRLRKKLSQLTNAKKNAKGMNDLMKNINKSSEQVIETLMKETTTTTTATRIRNKCDRKENVSKKIEQNKFDGVNEQHLTVKSELNQEMMMRSCSEAMTKNDDGNLDEWIKDTLNFIEGGKETKRIDRTVNNKKAAKKAKQKQKKEEQKRIEELQDLRSQFYDLYFKEFISKTELRNQKSSKKKDKKRITELEASIKKVNKAKSKIESSILELISTVKALNTDFKFAYLPTKEQQQEMLSKAFPEETTTIETTTTTATGKRRESVPINHLPASETIPPPRLSCPVSQQHIPYTMQGNLMQPNLQSFQSSFAPPDDPTDSTKRIVTIRRVTLPHASEPQVTVTAKGDSPDKDKLLYTFINGQLVPATTPENPALKAIQSRLTKKVQQTLQLIAQNDNKKFPAVGNNEAPQNISAAKTKTQLKKERKRAKKLLEEQKTFEIVETVVNETSVSNSKNNRNSKNGKSTQNVVVVEENQSCKTKTKKEKKTDAIKTKVTAKNCNGDAASIVPNNVEHKSQQKTSKQQQTSQNKNSISSKTRPDKKLELTNETTDLKVTKSKSANNKVVDNGQFDNNQFKMLHLDELVESDNFENRTATNFGQKTNSKIENAKHKIQSGNTVSNKKGKKKTNEKSIMQQNQNDGEMKMSNGNDATIKRNELKNTITKNNKTVSALKKSGNPSSNLVDQRNNKNINTVAANSDDIVKNLQLSMQKLHLNADTTIEPARINSETKFSSTNLNISIMEQLNRGVQVEDLALPPGITLTKVDPSRAEMLRAKTESIGKLSQPMQAQSQPNHVPPPIIAPTLLPHFGKYGPDQSGVIMVDAMNLKHRSSENNATSSAESKNKSKRLKRKNKKKKSADVNNANETQTKVANSKTNEPKMITLRNPMFHGAPVVPNPVYPLQNKMPAAPLPVDQPAAIIKNENGMFTIRNPALHQAFLNGLQTNFRQYSPGFVPATSGDENFIGEYTYFSGNSSQNGTYDNQQNHNHNSMNKGKYLSAIGSEVKNAQQKKLNNQWPTIQHPQHQSPCFNQQHHASTACGGYLGQMGQCSPIQDNYHQSHYYNGSRGSLFSNSTHNCGDDSPPPTVTGFNRYLDGFSENDGNKYDEMTFLKNLIPGQRLNSEVTIHNINESKFNNRNNNISPISHRVEITPISRPSSRPNNFNNTENHSMSALQNAVGGGGMSVTDCGYGENILLHKQRLNLNDNKIDNDTFKQHFNYGFDSTSSSSSLSNDFKVNINLNSDQLCSQNPTQNSSRSSPYLSNDSMENFVNNMNSLKLSSDNSGCVNGNRWW